MEIATPNVHRVHVASFSVFFSVSDKGSVSPGSVLHCLAEQESFTLENEDVVAMGTLNPSVTQRVPCR